MIIFSNNQNTIGDQTYREHRDNHPHTANLLMEWNERRASNFFGLGPKAHDETAHSESAGASTRWKFTDMCTYMRTLMDGNPLLISGS